MRPFCFAIVFVFPEGFLLHSLDAAYSKIAHLSTATSLRLRLPLCFKGVLGELWQTTAISAGVCESVCACVFAFLEAPQLAQLSFSFTAFWGQLSAKYGCSSALLQIQRKEICVCF